jgi:hypothetical protein
MVRIRWTRGRAGRDTSDTSCIATYFVEGIRRKWSCRSCSCISWYHPRAHQSYLSQICPVFSCSQSSRLSRTNFCNQQRSFFVLFFSFPSLSEKTENSNDPVSPFVARLNSALLNLRKTRIEIPLPRCC